MWFYRAVICALESAAGGMLFTGVVSVVVIAVMVAIAIFLFGCFAVMLFWPLGTFFWLVSAATYAYDWLLAAMVLLNLMWVGYLVTKHGKEARS